MKKPYIRNSMVIFSTPPPEMNHNLKSGPHFWNSSTFSHITMILMCCQLRLSIKYGQQSQNEWIFFFILVLGARLVKKRSWIDPDFREWSSTKRSVPARACSHFLCIIKNCDPSSCSHMTCVFVCKQTDHCLVFCLFKVFFLSFFLICCWHLFADSM